jgi:hypothetical protein
MGLMEKGRRQLMDEMGNNTLLANGFHVQKRQQSV